MAARKTQKHLNVYLNGLFIGILESRQNRNLAFSYAPEWLGRSTCFPISRSLPLKEEAHVGNKVYAYFDNLLPDNVSTRQRIAAQMKAETDNVFDLLAKVGRDCVGALQFNRSDEPAPALQKAQGTLISETKIAEKLRGLKKRPLAVSSEADFRLSIAGAQEKTALLQMDGKWLVPRGATPTTHIFKPQIGPFETGLNFSDSVENEWLCAEILREFEIPITKCKMAQFEDVKVLVAERFDRIWQGKTLIRIPQEDMCQAYGVANFEKYQNDGGPGMTQIMEILNESKCRERDRKNFMKTQVVFLLLAAIDGHGKNFSIRWGPDGFELTPLYDVLSAQPMIDASIFQIEKLKMAMSVGNNKRYRVRDIFRRHFIQTAKQCRFDIEQMELIIEEVIRDAPRVVERVSRKLKKFPMDVSKSISEGLLRRLSQIQSVS